ncbi:hypothetical protein KGM_213586 [Danaus plexippus plexippus]|uniref:U5 small nuclear ribonucleoprotein TSSC4 n=1 Tax=Danaus plexippus plexippus TaxID=278856 RepID=A0A212ENS0_DANPL|nr:hypothetical protein KGM_213586 [Danaus plexippus plexippus]
MSSFHERQKNLFNTLKNAEEQCGYTVKSNADETNFNEIDRRTYQKLKHEMKQFRRKESIFKRQEASLRQCLRSKTQPDYIKNPQKWVYYTLSDVTPDQMSDKTNTETALAFIREMEDREENKNMEVTDDTGAVFKKPVFNISKTIKLNSEEKQQPVFKSNKIIMPEYIVGVSGKKPNKKPVIKNQTNTEEKKVELKLNHLYNDNDDDDGEDFT